MFQRTRHRSSVIAAVALALSPCSALAQLVISQVYGGGGNTGAPFTHDFIELINRGMTPVSLAGLSVQVTTAGGSTWGATALPDVPVAPGQYYLIQQSGGTIGAPLPAPDAIGTLFLSASSGKAALVSGALPISGSCPSTNVLDLVGYGATTCFEGIGPAPVLSNLLAAVRVTAGCQDVNRNATDFMAATPNPRNTASPTAACEADAPPSGSGVAIPDHCPSDSVVLNVQTSRGVNPHAEIASVTANLTNLGGPPTRPLRDDGVAPDLIAGDLLFSATANIGAAIPVGMHIVPVAILDIVGRSGSAFISVSVVNCNPMAVGIPSTLCTGQVGLLTATATPGILPPSSQLFVRANLVPFGGPAQALFHDDGQMGDLVAADGTFSFLVPVPPTQPLVDVTVAGTVTDERGRSSTFTFSVSFEYCGPIAVGTPSLLCTGQLGLLTVAPTPGLRPPSVELFVRANLVPLGGPAQADFHDDGELGDPVAADQIFSLLVPVPPTQPPGTVTLTGTVADELGRSSTFTFGVSTAACLQSDTPIVISQVYGAGGEAGASLTHDFIELFNRSAAPVVIDGWSVQFALAAPPAEFTELTPLAGVIPPGGYYLVRQAAGPAGSVPLPTPDALGDIDLGSAAGHVALVGSTVLIDLDCAAAAIIDLVGYGSPPVACREGLGSAPALGALLAAIRLENGCFDADINGIDFAAAPPAPRNSAAPPDPCFRECPCDLNRDRVVESSDFFAFLAAFFAGNPVANINGDMRLDSLDFFYFLACFFAAAAC